MDFLSDCEDCEECEYDLQLSSFLSLRSDLSRGDFRCLYLGWLSGLQDEECGEEQLEPPVPPGLQSLNPALIELASFLRINPDLIQIAASASAPFKDATPQPEDLRSWLSILSPKEKDDMLEKILEGGLRGDQTPTLLHTNRFIQLWHSLRKNDSEGQKRRTIGQLLKKIAAH